MKKGILRSVAVWLIPCLVLDTAQASHISPISFAIICRQPSNIMTIQALAGRPESVPAGPGTLSTLIPPIIMQGQPFYAPTLEDMDAAVSFSRGIIIRALRNFRDIHEVDFGDGLVGAFEKANLAIPTDIDHDDELWLWRGVHLYLTASALFGISSPDSSLFPLFKRHHSFGRKITTGSFYQIISGMVVQTQYEINKNRDRKRIVFKTEIVWPLHLKHSFDDLPRFGHDRREDVIDSPNTRPHADFGEKWVHQVPLYHEPDLKTAQRRILDSLEKIDLLLGALPLASLETVCAVADEMRQRLTESVPPPVVLDSSASSVRSGSRSDPDSVLPSLPIAQKKDGRPWFAQGSNGRLNGKPQRRSAPRYVVEKTIDRWRALVERIGKTGAVVLTSVGMLVMGYLFFGSLWVMLVDAQHSGMVTLNESAPSSYLKEMKGDLPLASSENELALVPIPQATPSKEKKMFKPTWPVALKLNDDYKGYFPAFWQQSLSLQYDILNGADPSFMKFAKEPHVKKIMAEIGLLGGPLNRSMTGNVIHWNRYHGTINKDSPEITDLAGDMSYEETVVNADLFGPIAMKAKKLHYETNQLSDQLVGEARNPEKGDGLQGRSKNDQARLETLRTLWRLLFVEMAVRNEMTENPAYFIRATLRALSHERFKAFSGYPNSYLDAYLRPFIRDWISTWEPSKMKSYLYAQERGLTLAGVRQAKADVPEVVSGFSNFWWEKETFASRAHMTSDELRVFILCNSLTPEMVEYGLKGSKGPLPKLLEKDPMRRLVLDFVMVKVADGALLVNDDRRIIPAAERVSELYDELRQQGPTPPIAPYRGNIPKHENSGPVGYLRRSS